MATEGMGGSLTGISADEAKEFHKLFMQGFFIFSGIALVAHILVWLWRPWIPGDEGYTALLDGAQGVAQTALTLIA
ncbi:MAG: light-harvesting antenna LH1, beta subunit [Geminicoccaceae bacterium]